ncbi:MAG: peptide-methionine (S)-S-oxide reductase MsrA [Hyphomicrobiaceae bacterium]
MSETKRLRDNPEGFSMIRRILTLLTCYVAMLTVLPIQVGAGDRSSAGKTTRTSIATFAAGCFWCTESDFDKVPGVLKTVSGYMGGHLKNPTYKKVVRGGTGHAEVLQVTYDPAKVSYEKLLSVFWRNVDPYDINGQFCDRGDQYRPEIFVHSKTQKEVALKSRAAIVSQNKSSRKIVVPITLASKFTRAEDYHQNFYKKNPGHYWRYRFGCGRDRRLEMIWGPKVKS